MIWSPQTVQKRQRKCFIYFPRFLPSDLQWGTQHQSLESLMGLSISTVKIRCTSGVATKTGSNDACSLRQITWSINEKTGVSAGMEMTRKYRIRQSFQPYTIVQSSQSVFICPTELGLWCLTPLSTIFQLYRGGQFYLREETRVPGEYHWPVGNLWQTLSHNVRSSTPHHDRDSNSQLMMVDSSGILYSSHPTLWQLTGFLTISSVMGLTGYWLLVSSSSLRSTPFGIQL
jgi:hypothetical protein